MDVLRPVRAFDRYQQRHRALSIPMAVLRKFGNDQAGNLAALVAYRAFFSLFPLLLVFVTILGFVLQGNPSTANSIANSAVSQFPVVGQQIQAHGLAGHGIALAVGLGLSLWAGLGVTNAVQNAFDRVWAVPFKDRPDYLHSRLRGLVLLLTLGVLFIVSSVVSGVVIGGLGGLEVKIGGVVLSLLLNFTMFFLAFRFLTAATVPTRCLWVGIAVAAGFWEILQAFGGYYVEHVIKSSSTTYGTFQYVIALLVWLHLGAQMTLYAAEINVVLARRLYPRSLMGPPEEPADKATLRALAKVEERHETEQVDVRFEP